MKLIQIAVWLLPPGRFKNRLLGWFGHDIAMTARIAPVLVTGLGRANIGERSTVGPLNLFRSLAFIDIQEDVSIGTLNTFSAHPAYREIADGAGSLLLDRGSFITNRHYFDCSGTLHVGEFAAFCGQRTTLLTHELDYTVNQQSVGRVIIGERSAVLTSCVVLKGAYLPPRSLLAASSTLVKAKAGAVHEPGMYAGTPARRVSDLIDGPDTWFNRTESATTRMRADTSLGRGEQAGALDNGALG